MTADNDHPKNPLNSQEMIQREAEELCQQYALPADRVIPILEKTIREKPISYFPKWVKDYPGEDEKLSEPMFIPSLRDALEILNPDEAFNLFEREDPEMLVNRLDITLSFSFNSWFLSLNELADATEQFMAYLKKNRNNLIKFGYPYDIFYFSLGFQMMMGRLYPTVLYEMGELSEVKAILGEYTLTISESKDNLIDGLDIESSKKITGLREKILKAKLEVLNIVVVGLTLKKTENIWNKSLEILIKAFDANDIEFLLALDENVYSSHSSGGMIELFRFIGHAEEELTIGTQARTREILGNLLQPLGNSPPLLLYGDDHLAYFRLVKDGHREQLDEAIDLFIQLDKQEKVFWREYHNRINEALANDFYSEVVIKTKIKHKYLELFEPHVKAYTELRRAEYESFGKFPANSDKTDDKTEKKDDNIFLREGEMWTIRFKGKKSFKLNDTDGLHYIAYLLEHPRAIVSIRQLKDVIKKKTHSLGSQSRTYSKISTKRLSQEEGLNIEGIRTGGNDDHKKEIIKEYEDRKMEIEIEMEAVTIDNSERMDELREDLNSIEKEISHLTAKDDEEEKIKKIRQSISSCIHRDLKRIKKEDEELFKHFELYLLPVGSNPSYSLPENDGIEWVTQ